MLRSRKARPSREGFTLVELLVAFTVLAIFGAAFVRFLLSQARYTDQQNALRAARTTSRQAMNILESELRMVQDSGGVEVATSDGRSLRVLVPYRFGLICGVSGANMVVSMLPVDSLVLSQSRFAGYGWRNGSGAIALAGSGSAPPVASSDPTRCATAQVQLPSLNGRSPAVLDVRPVQPLAQPGQVIFFFQRVNYSFATSNVFPGQYGLYRGVEGGSYEEIMAPFDITSRFRYWTRGATASVTAAPPLSQIRGIDLVLVARSAYTPIGGTTPATSDAVASIFFRNVRK